MGGLRLEIWIPFRVGRWIQKEFEWIKLFIAGPVYPSAVVKFKAVVVIDFVTDKSTWE